MNDAELVIYCADVGSFAQGSFGWAGTNRDGGRRQRGEAIEELLDRLTSDLKGSRPVALGLECPLFVPVPETPDELGKQRHGERGSPWNMVGGLSSMAFGLVEGAWLLRALSRDVRGLEVTLDWQAFLAEPRGLLLWEAFVTGSAKAADGTHSGDAAVACDEFVKRLTLPVSDVTADRPLSLAGALLLWSGLSTDPSALASEPLVVRP